MKQKITDLLTSILPNFLILVSEQGATFDNDQHLKIVMGIGSTSGGYLHPVSLALNTTKNILSVQIYGGQGGQSIYRETDPNNPKEKYLAFGRIKIPFKRPQCNEDAVLRAIERFAKNYKQAISDNKEVLISKDRIDFNALGV